MRIFGLCLIHLSFVLMQLLSAFSFSLSTPCVSASDLYYSVELRAQTLNELVGIIKQIFPVVESPSTILLLLKRRLFLLLLVSASISF
jgi:hypothetical protein